jgi:hypothetical protein
MCAQYSRQLLPICGLETTACACVSFHKYEVVVLDGKMLAVFVASLGLVFCTFVSPSILNYYVRFVFPGCSKTAGETCGWVFCLSLRQHWDWHKLFSLSAQMQVCLHTYGSFFYGNVYVWKLWFMPLNLYLMEVLLANATCSQCKNLPPIALREREGERVA